MGVTHADFNALVEHLIIAMEKHNIPVSAQNQLLAKLAPMYGDIAEK
jgi:hemoglobin